MDPNNFCVDVLIFSVKIWVQWYLIFLFHLPTPMHPSHPIPPLPTPGDHMARIKTKSCYMLLAHILCRGDYFQIRDHAGNTVYHRRYYTELSDELIQVLSGGKVTIQVKLQSDNSHVRGHFAVLNKRIEYGKAFFTKQNTYWRYVHSLADIFKSSTILTSLTSFGSV